MDIFNKWEKNSMLFKLNIYSIFPLQTKKKYNSSVSYYLKYVLVVKNVKTLSAINVTARAECR
jgi:hypothetical protein